MAISSVALYTSIYIYLSSLFHSIYLLCLALYQYFVVYQVCVSTFYLCVWVYCSDENDWEKVINFVEDFELYKQKRSHDTQYSHFLLDIMFKNLYMFRPLPYLYNWINATSSKWSNIMKVLNISLSFWSIEKFKF